MKSFLKIFVLSLVLFPSFSHAQAYPSRPITLVVPFAPGGGTNSLAKLMQDKLGQPVVVGEGGLEID